MEMESIKGSLLLCSVINCTAVTSLVNTLPGKRARSKGSKAELLGYLDGKQITCYGNQICVN